MFNLLLHTFIEVLFFYNNSNVTWNIVVLFELLIYYQLLIYNRNDIFCNIKKNDLWYQTVIISISHLMP